MILRSRIFVGLIEVLDVIGSAAEYQILWFTKFKLRFAESEAVDTYTQLHKPAIDNNMQT